MLQKALADPARGRRPCASWRPRGRRTAPARALLALLVASLLGTAPGCSLLLDFDVQADAAVNVDAATADAAPADAGSPDAAAAIDAGPDASIPDAGAPDAGD